MSISVKEALELDALSEAKIIAGESGLERLIEKVNVAECPMDCKRNRQGEFFLSALYANKENVIEQYNTIKLLIETGSSGLCLIDKYMVDLDPSIKKMADENSFPILMVPSYIYYSEIISSIMNAIIQKKNFFMQEMMIDNILSNSKNPSEIKRIARQINKDFKSNILAIYCKVNKSDLICKYETIRNTFIEKDYWSIIAYKSGILLLVSFTNKPSNLGFFISDTINKIEYIAPDNYIGISNMYNGIENLALCIEEALLAVELSEKTLKQKCLYYKDIGLYKIILPYKNDFAYESFYKEIISPIVEHDLSYNTSLLETAIEYINNDGDFTECSKNLYVHENTIRYRINKIREILDMEASFYKFYEQLSVAIKLHNLLVNDSQ